MDQNYKNHRRYVPAFHFFTGAITIACFIGGFIFAARRIYFQKYVYPGLLIFGITVVLAMLFWFCRAFALRAQDRAIRAEENLRHFVMTGQLLDARLQMSQITALRFAGDAEFVALAKKAADEGLKSNEIKKAVQQWRPDHNRA